MICVALLLVLITWLTLCMALISACFAPDVSASDLSRDLEEQPTDTAISREGAARAVCVTCSLVLLISVATRYTC